jgi:hypothetical protein
MESKIDAQLVKVIEKEEEEEEEVQGTREHKVAFCFRLLC